jgi:hypothetical protein
VGTEGNLVVPDLCAVLRHLLGFQEQALLGPLEDWEEPEPVLLDLYQKMELSDLVGKAAFHKLAEEVEVITEVSLVMESVLFRFLMHELLFIGGGGGYSGISFRTLLFFKFG